jgi:hypothetical protein
MTAAQLYLELLENVEREARQVASLLAFHASNAKSAPGLLSPNAAVTTLVQALAELDAFLRDRCLPAA